MKKSTFYKICFLFMGSILVVNINAQSSVDTLATTVQDIQTEITGVKKIKFSGLIQAQYQIADTIGSPSVAGGDFKGLDNRFQVRRARLKAAYSGENSTIAVQFDLKDDGSVKVKEAYGIYMEPWLKTFSLTGGFFNRPIGNEVEYSSALLESPERARVTQYLFPDEVDMGAKLTIHAPKTSSLNFIKLDLALMTGNAIASETDKYKDFIGHLTFKKTILDENLTLSGGISYYNGGFAVPASAKSTLNNPFIYTLDGGKYSVDSTRKVGTKTKRQYYGFDAQATLSSGIGITSLRGEYLTGQQPGTGSSSKAAPFAATADVYERNFNGGYVYFIHRILQTKHELVVKYDWYDPNTKIAGNEIGATTTATSNPTKTGYADVKYVTLGLGWNYYMTSNVRFTVYYDMVSNETTNSVYFVADGKNNGTKNITKDLKDNVLTLRMVYKF